MSNKWYDVFKFIALVVLPGVGALYFGLAQIWGLPKAEEVVGTITVLDTFLGLLLKASSAAYDKNKYDGKILVAETDHKVVYRLDFENQDPDELFGKKEILFKVEDMPKDELDIEP